MNLLGAHAPCFSLVSGFSCVTTRGIMQKLAEQSQGAQEGSSAEQGGLYAPLSNFQPPKT